MPTKPTAPNKSNRPAARLSLCIQYALPVAQVPANRAQLRRWVRAALESDAILTLRFVDEDEGRALNKTYRGRDHATNVLTFTYDEPATPAHGDIVICVPILAREAQEQNKSLRDHLAHLLIHGTLHAQGWDHEDPNEAEAMEAREAALLNRFKIANPYA
jgi:probable rRNA maturation factor